MAALEPFKVGEVAAGEVPQTGDAVFHEVDEVELGEV